MYVKKDKNKKTRIKIKRRKKINKLNFSLGKKFS